jgi:hypothetical protein
VDRTEHAPTADLGLETDLVEQAVDAGRAFRTVSAAARPVQPAPVVSVVRRVAKQRPTQCWPGRDAVVTRQRPTQW